MPTERTMPDAGVPRYLDILFERPHQLPESYFVSMEIDGMYLGEGGFVVMLLEPSMGASAPEYTRTFASGSFVSSTPSSGGLPSTMPMCSTAGSPAYWPFPDWKSAPPKPPTPLRSCTPLLTIFAQSFPSRSRPVCFGSSATWGSAPAAFAPPIARSAISYSIRRSWGPPRVSRCCLIPRVPRNPRWTKTSFLSDSAEKVSRLLCSGNQEDAQAQLSMAVDYCIHAVPCFFPMMRMPLLTLFDHLILAILRENHVLRSFLQQQSILTELLMAPTRQALQTQTGIRSGLISIGHMAALEAQPGIQLDLFRPGRSVHHGNERSTPYLSVSPDCPALSTAPAHTVRAIQAVFREKYHRYRYPRRYGFSHARQLLQSSEYIPGYHCTAGGLWQSGNYEPCVSEVRGDRAQSAPVALL